MTTKQEILDLAERVEAGTEHGRIFDDLCMLWGTDTNTTLDACSATDGSLDAAKALYDAVLPGWGLKISYNKDGCRVVVLRYCGEFGPCSCIGTCDNSIAAAWVAAILRAKAEECE